MKTLYIVRHAKSSWEEGVEDHKRSLNSRGIKDAKLVSEYISDKLRKPQNIYTSDAQRAKTTAGYFKEAFEVVDSDFILNSDLYDFSGQKVMEVIKNLSDKQDCVMIVGHNQAVTSIVNMLGDSEINHLPTCGFVEIQFTINSWKFINYGHISTLVFPRDLKPKSH